MKVTLSQSSRTKAGDTIAETSYTSPSPGAMGLGVDEVSSDHRHHSVIQLDPFRVRQILAFAIVYVIWGSTYLAMRFAIETLPGTTMAGSRFLVAGSILYGWARLRGAQSPTAGQWRAAAWAGALLFVGGNGIVVWAQHYVPSGLAALLVGTEPLWVAVILLARPGSTGRPTARTFAALAIGFAGAAVLAGPASVGGTPIARWAAVLILVAPLSWAAGSLYASRADLHSSPMMATATQMLCGGAILFGLGVILGDWRTFDPTTVSTKSWLALGYLVIFGALVAFSAYSWLVRTTEPTLVSTFAYVNPVVAVFLGWWLADEAVGWHTLVATVLIISAVILLSTGSRRRPEPAPLASCASTATLTAEKIAHPSHP